MPNPNTNDVDLYCTHGELADELGSARKLAKLIPADYAGNPESEDATALVRAQALRDTLKALRRRTPPIFEHDISVPSELKDAVAFGALMRLYRAAMTTDDDVNAMLYREFRQKFDAEIGGLNLTVDAAVTAPNAIRVWRG